MSGSGGTRKVKLPLTFLQSLQHGERSKLLALPKGGARATHANASPLRSNGQEGAPGASPGRGRSGPVAGAGGGRGASSAPSSPGRSPSPGPRQRHTARTDGLGIGTVAKLIQEPHPDDWEKVELRVRASTLAAELERAERRMREAAGRERALQAQLDASHKLLCQRAKELGEAAEARKALEAAVSKQRVATNGVAMGAEALRSENAALRGALERAEAQAKQLGDSLVWEKGRVQELQAGILQQVARDVGVDGRSNSLRKSRDQKLLAGIPAPDSSGADATHGIKMAGLQAQLGALRKERDALATRVKDLTNRLADATADANTGRAAQAQRAAVSERAASRAAAKAAAAAQRVGELSNTLAVRDRELKQRVEYTGRLERVVLQQHRLIQQLQQQMSTHSGSTWAAPHHAAAGGSGLLEGTQTQAGASAGVQWGADTTGAAARHQFAEAGEPGVHVHGDAEDEMHQGSWAGFPGLGGFEASGSVQGEAPPSSSGRYGAAATLRQHLLDITTVEDGLSQLEATLQRFTAAGVRPASNLGGAGRHSAPTPAGRNQHAVPASVARASAARLSQPSAPPSSYAAQRPSSTHGGGAVPATIQGRASAAAAAGSYGGAGEGEEEWAPQPRTHAPPSPSPPTSPRAALRDGPGHTSPDRMEHTYDVHVMYEYPVSPTTDAADHVTRQEAARQLPLGSFGAWVAPGTHDAGHHAPSARTGPSGPGAPEVRYSQPDEYLSPKYSQPEHSQRGYSEPVQPARTAPAPAPHLPQSLEQRPAWGGGGGAVRSGRVVSPGLEVVRASGAHAVDGWTSGGQQDRWLDVRAAADVQQQQRLQVGVSPGATRHSPPRLMADLGAGGAGGTWHGRVLPQQAWEDAEAAGSGFGGRAQRGRSQGPVSRAPAPALMPAPETRAQARKYVPLTERTHDEGEDAHSLHTPQPRYGAPAAAYPTIHLHLPPDQQHEVELQGGTYAPAPSSAPLPRPLPLDALYGQLPPSASPPQYPTLSPGMAPGPSYTYSYSPAVLQQAHEYSSFEEGASSGMPTVAAHVGGAVQAGPAQLSRTAEALQRLAQRLRPLSRRLSGEQVS